jgi:hypothetical protein
VFQAYVHISRVVDEVVMAVPVDVHLPPEFIWVNWGMAEPELLVLYQGMHVIKRVSQVPHWEVLGLMVATHQDLALTCPAANVPQAGLVEGDIAEEIHVVTLGYKLVVVLFYQLKVLFLRLKLSTPLNQVGMTGVDVANEPYVSH